MDSSLLINRKTADNEKHRQGHLVEKMVEERGGNFGTGKTLMGASFIPEQITPTSTSLYQSQGSRYKRCLDFFSNSSWTAGLLGHIVDQSLCKHWEQEDRWSSWLERREKVTCRGSNNWLLGMLFWCALRCYWIWNTHGKIHMPRLCSEQYAMLVWCSFELWQ